MMKLLRRESKESNINKSFKKNLWCLRAGGEQILMLSFLEGKIGFLQKDVDIRLGESPKTCFFKVKYTLYNMKRKDKV